MPERVIYTAEPGEILKLLPDGRTIIAHPEKHPRVLYPDGKIEKMTPENCPLVWHAFESVIKQILRPN